MVRLRSSGKKGLVVMGEGQLCCPTAALKDRALRCPTAVRVRPDPSGLKDHFVARPLR
ncbi:MAG: hypothetical protein SOT07_04865 [Paludibacteraceae bacterium]|nr:hypothetical protein [Paludibacteraceae bacterium]